MTAYISRHASYKSIRIPFGLKNGPGKSQPVMDEILSMIIEQYALVYSDDIFIFSEKTKEHINHARSVLGLLKYTGVRLRLKTVIFLQSNTLSRPFG